MIGDFAIIACENDELDLGVVRKIFTPEQFMLNENVDKRRVMGGLIIRTATEQERTYLPMKHAQEIKLFQYCKHLVEENQMNIKVFGVDFQFDGNLVTVYYTCTSPVNLTDLVAALHKMCRTPVYMCWTPRRIRYSAKSLASRSLVTGQMYFA